MDFNTLAPLISGIAWTITYFGIVYRIFKDKTPGMPVAALCLNFAWEITYSVIYPPASSITLIIINVIWMIFDALIVVGTLLYGPKDYKQRFGINRPIFYFMFIIGIVASFGIMLLGPNFFGSMTIFHHDSFEVAKFIALIQNLVMSILFVSQFYSRKRFDNPIAGQSFMVAAAKWLGTPLTVGLLQAVADPTGFMSVIVGLTLICDTWYMLVLYREIKAQGLSPFKRI
ncbi:hypothetical protein CPR19088_GLDEOEPO_01229 [Companilactobacillus paralimentarius]